MSATVVPRAAALAAAVCWPTPLPAQRPLAIRSETVAPGYVVISGYTNGNVLAVIGDRGVLLVDAQSARRVPQADSALRTVTAQPVRWVIVTHYHVTHYHADHLEGNAYWRVRGAEVIGHESIAAEARKDTTIPELAWHRVPAAPAALPSRAFRDSLVLRFEGTDVAIRHAAAAPYRRRRDHLVPPGQRGPHGGHPGVGRPAVRGLVGGRQSGRHDRRGGHGAAAGE